MLNDPYNRVILHKNRVSNTSSFDLPNTVYGRDDSFDIDAFRKNLSIEFKVMSPDFLEFDLVGVDASVANAFRRIMVAEVPTMAIEHLYIIDNTSVIPDETLAHRIGLLPIKADPTMFSMITKGILSSYMEIKVHLDEPKGTNNSLIFRLHAERSIKDAKQKQDDSITSFPVTCADMVWFPQPNQLERLQKRVQTTGSKIFEKFWRDRVSTVAKNHESYQFPKPITEEEAQFTQQIDAYSKQFPSDLRWSIYPIHEDILVDKLGPGQKIDIEAHIVKGIGKDHAKFSPVCPASYRLHPEIIIKEPIRGEDALKFQACFPEGVIGIRQVKVAGSSRKVDEAYVEDARRDTVSRECLRHNEFKDKVILTRIKNHFIFNIESVGQYDSPADIFIESCKILLAKCNVVKDALENLQSDVGK